MSAISGKTWLVIPVKPATGAKSRLAAALDPPEREALVKGMLARVFMAASECPLIGAVSLVGTSHNGLPDEVELLADPGEGLNAAMQGVLAEAHAREAARLVVIHGDLPGVAADDIATLAGVSGPVVGIAPDRHGSGTNALSLPLPQAASFRFAFGAGSQSRHRAEAGRLGLEWTVIERPGLACDVDDAADLAAARDLAGTISLPSRS